MTKIELADGIALIDDQNNLYSALLNYAKTHSESSPEQYVNVVTKFINDKMTWVLAEYRRNWDDLESVRPENLIAELEQAIGAVLDFSNSGKNHDDLVKQIMVILKPLIEEIDTYFRSSKGVKNEVNGNWEDKLEHSPIEPFNIYHAGYQTFHQYLLNQIEQGKMDKIDAVITDPPYYINLASWDKELPDTSDSEGVTSKESEFKNYLLSVNPLLSDDAFLLIFNTYENV